MNQVASHLANTKELAEALENGRLKGEGDNERADYFIFLWGMERVCVANYLIGGDQLLNSWIRLKLPLG